MRLDAIEFPELVFGLAGPIGVDMDALTATFMKALSEVGYDSSVVRLTSLFKKGAVDADLPARKPASCFNDFMWKMDSANALRRASSDSAVLARLAIVELRQRRRELTGDAAVVSSRRAFVIRQLKHPEEVKLLRKVYGKLFFLVSAHAPRKERLELLKQRIRRDEGPRCKSSHILNLAMQLIERDEGEDFGYGQQLRDTFHLADVFVDASSKARLAADIHRFVAALFGRNDVSPTKAEYGMYAAKTASLRSADLSRQVGAAIFSEAGEIVSQGCNEVPKVGGGTYWAGENPDHRDVRRGFDPNDAVKREIVRDLVERLVEGGILSDTARDLAEKLVESRGPLRGSSLMDLTEFGRVVHAEMGAICDAARLGRPVKGAVLYCTTFPCHNCTKHILASGITRVVYMEPYPKSRAEQLHGDEIDIEVETTSGRVCFVPFSGISPRRYRDLFEKARRKDADGRATEWEAGSPRPRVDIVYPSHPLGEVWAIHPLAGAAAGGPDARP